ncbi:hypothetical protein Huta_1859 [Halorhabdus utahensis DSM 12940]|uniref:DUF7577 domain-containing protein n=1 Tax=Halorhabdus utahensis (strain DSM 12940 / JCM 11049 / AX-2) TaxID=519442 RepID=C7NSE2_HALUD|nr:hypothetical protein [Halorhabdus utahensis]ACV12029.1 hypothetical protein Huta_1859 [Halorhabdus utahensis DSM 12940]
MTPVWGWIVAYILGFLLFQLLIYWYLGEDGTSIERTTPDSTEQERGPRPSIETRDTDEGDVGETVRCRHCGAANEFHPSYRFCRVCAREYR